MVVASHNLRMRCSVKSLEATMDSVLELEFLLLLEEHCKADNGRIYQHSTYYRHDHCLHTDEIAVCKEGG